jgi:hypothetical protein
MRAVTVETAQITPPLYQKRLGLSKLGLRRFFFFFVFLIFVLLTLFAFAFVFTDATLILTAVLFIIAILLPIVAPIFASIVSHNQVCVVDRI